MSVNRSAKTERDRPTRRASLSTVRAELELEVHGAGQANLHEGRPKGHQQSRRPSVRRTRGHPVRTREQVILIDGRSARQIGRSRMALTPALTVG
jgi:hypothetical protein